jgi:hypothetical protein
MADFRALAKDLCLADRKIDEGEVRILKKHLYSDGKIDRKEIEFLIELRNAAKRTGGVKTVFEDFFYKAVYDGVIGNGIISAGEATLLRKAILADNRVEEPEKRLMRKLKNAARKTAPQFDRLYKQVVG